MLILEDSPYGDWVPIQVGTYYLDWITDLISKDEINALTRKWPLGWMATPLANKSAILKAENVDSIDPQQSIWKCRNHCISRNCSISDSSYARVVC